MCGADFERTLRGAREDVLFDRLWEADFGKDFARDFMRDFGKQTLGRTLGETLPGTLGNIILVLHTVELNREQVYPIAHHLWRTPSGF